MIDDDYPEIGKSIFGGVGSEGEASLETDWRSASGYRHAYQTAADKLVQDLGESGGFSDDDPDVLVYPVLFLYRHCLELRIKETLLCLRILQDVQPEIPEGHGLAGLWKEARRRLLEHSEGTGEWDPFVPDLEARILEFHTIDKDSTGLRYSFERDGAKTLSSFPNRSGAKDKSISLAHVKSVFADMDAVFELIYLTLDNALTARGIYLWDM
ncbi:MAG: hypothetical protein OXE43_08055 [Chloroflexi bacterium]|nr:hypothetical protein [Chloroflexota bacterium]